MNGLKGIDGDGLVCSLALVAGEEVLRLFVFNSLLLP